MEQPIAMSGIYLDSDFENIYDIYETKIKL